MSRKKEFIYRTFAEFLEDNQNQVEAINRILTAIFQNRRVYLKDIATNPKDYAYIRKVAFKLGKRGILKKGRDFDRGNRKWGRWWWTLSDDFIYIVLKIADEVKFEKRVREGKY